MENYDILINPVISEKAVNGIEIGNKIIFRVAKSATKPEIKKAMEETYAVKVDKINIVNDTKGYKKAIIKLNSKFKASELSSKLGMI